MADLDFFFDPVCPWAWITSRWVTEAQQLREYDINWRFISLAVINDDLVADWYTPEYRAGHIAGLQGLRVADAVRLADGNEAVARLYTALGTAFHPEKRRQEFQDDPVEFMRWALGEAKADQDLAQHVFDESHDAYIRADTALAFERTGYGVGTPDPHLQARPAGRRQLLRSGDLRRSLAARRRSGCGMPIELIATTTGVAELKRSNRARPVFD